MSGGPVKQYHVTEVTGLDLGVFRTARVVNYRSLAILEKLMRDWGKSPLRPTNKRPQFCRHQEEQITYSQFE